MRGWRWIPIHLPFPPSSLFFTILKTFHLPSIYHLSLSLSKLPPTSDNAVSTRYFLIPIRTRVYNKKNFSPDRQNAGFQSKTLVCKV